MGTTATVEADFTGPYDHANWTFTQVGDSSTVTTPTSLSLVGDDSMTGGIALYTIAAVADGTVSFDWSYSSTDIDDYDYGGFYLNGAFTTLAFNSTQGAGNFSLAINAGDTFGFFVGSTDGAFDPGILDITNFNGPVAIPEPGVLGLLALGTIGGGLAFRRRRTK